MTCSVLGCERPSRARGWCDAHYRRWRRYGSVRENDSVLAYSRRDPACSVPGCDRKHVAKSLCNRHYKRAGEGLPLDVPPPTRYAGNLCQMAECAQFARARGWCAQHYSSQYSARRYRARKRDAITVAFTAEQLAARIAYYGDRCWLCGTPEWAALDHVKPLARGGPHMLSNLRPACSSCNRAKSDKWPLTAVAA